MQKYFISNYELNNSIINGEDVFHISVVTRSKINDLIIVSDLVKTFLAKITLITKKEVHFEKVEEITSSNELPFFVYLFQGFPKADKFETIIQQSVELGVYEIYGVFTKRSNVKLDKEKIKTRLERFNKISKEAAKQSHRDLMPDVKDIVDLKKIDFSSFDKKIVCYEEESKINEIKKFKGVIKSLKPNDKIAVIIGSEGGFDKEEIDYLKEKGFVSCSVGKRILRTQTASAFVLSAISYEWELKE